MGLGRVYLVDQHGLAGDGSPLDDPPARRDDLALPGEREFLTEQENLKTGIPIDVATIERLRQLAKERGISCPL